MRINLIHRHFSQLALKPLILGLTLILWTVAKVQAEELSWTTDFKQASQEAAQQHKHLLLDFTGSDWCPWCIKMDKEVFKQAAFSDFADKNLILVRLDFPRKSSQTEAEKLQNAELAKQYRIHGFPTYILLDENGKEVRRQEGYLQGGPSTLINWTGLSS